MRHKRVWVLLHRESVPEILLPLLTRSSAWMKHRRRKGWRLLFPLGFKTGLAKGMIMPSDTDHPVVYIPAQTALAHTGQQQQQQQQYLDVQQGQSLDRWREENQERHRRHSHPNVCLEGATEYYKEVTPDIDRFVPSYLEAHPLNESVGARRNDGTFPPWVTEGDPDKTPCQQYVEWFNYIWNTGDPSQWGPSVFTNNAVNVDPSGTTTGAGNCARAFILLFRHFPQLRGEVVSWAVNDRELVINWRFRIPNNVKDRLPIGPITQSLQEQQGGRDFLVPVIDKFSFVDGRVSFRAAYFDIITLMGYLSENLSANQLYDYLIAWTWNSLTSGGIPILPKMFINIFLGLFVWPPDPKPTGLVAFPGDSNVVLKWPKVEDASSYRLCRARALEGPYETLPIGGTTDEQKHYGNSYTDWDVTPGTPYWYTISASIRRKTEDNPTGRKSAPITDTLKIARARRA